MSKARKHVVPEAPPKIRFEKTTHYQIEGRTIAELEIRWILEMAHKYLKAGHEASFNRVNLKSVLGGPPLFILNLADDKDGVPLRVQMGTDELRRLAALLESDCDCDD